MGDCSLLRSSILLGGLECSDCAKAISKTISELEEVESCSLDFENRKLIIDILDIYNENEIISKVVDIINSIEPGINISVECNTVETKNKQRSRGRKINKNTNNIETKKMITSSKVEILLGGLNCAHCAETINDKVS